MNAQRSVAWRGVLAALVTVAAATQASAQSIQWGLWGDAPEKSSSIAKPAALGIPPMAVDEDGIAKGGKRPDIAAKKPQVASFANGFAKGSIVIDTSARKLYYTLSSSEAYVYPIAVGKQGFTWSGVEKVSRIENWPDWIPPAEMRQRKPGLPVRMAGGVNNPLGARAIYLGNTLYRIHGTNDASSIGSAASSGCFRMHNAHVVHLAGIVSTGTTVYVMKRLPKNGPAMPPYQAVEPAKQQTPDAAKPADGAQPQQAQPPAGETTPPAASEQPKAEPAPADGQKI